jgi:hypothetical protein
MDKLLSKETFDSSATSAPLVSFVQDLYSPPGSDSYASRKDVKLVDGRFSESTSDAVKLVHLRAVGSAVGMETVDDVRLISNFNTPTFTGDIKTRMNTPVCPEKAKVYEKIYRQIQAHEKFSTKLSYLGRVFDVVCQSDEESLEALRALQLSPFTGNAKRFEQRAEEAIKSDLEGIETQVEVHHYGSSTLKAAALCLKGPDAVVSSASLFAVDQMRPDDPLADQAIDGFLGTTKGALTYWTFGEIAASNMPGVARTFSTNVAGRVIDNGLNRINYYDQTGQFDTALGYKRTIQTALNPKTLSRDGAVMSTQNTMVGCMNFALGPSLSRSPILSSLAVNTTRGASSGIVNEVLNDLDAGEKPDLGKTLWKGGIQATLSNLSKIPAGYQTSPQASFASLFSERAKRDAP